MESNDGMTMSLPQSAAGSRAGHPSRTRTSRHVAARKGLRNFLLGGSRSRRHTVEIQHSTTQRPILGLGDLFSPRIVLPHMTDSYDVEPSEEATNEDANSQPRPQRSVAQTRMSQRNAIDYGLLSAPPTTQGLHRQVGITPEDQIMADLVASRRKRSKNGITKHHTHQSCFPGVKNKKIRSKVLTCSLSAAVLGIILTIYLAMAVSRVQSQTFHIILILVIMINLVFFCHSLVSLCITAARPSTSNRHRPQLAEMSSTGGFAIPREPIQVCLTRDEEAVGIESAATKRPPPAYGLWRESVRVDPNRIYWQRKQEAQENIVTIPKITATSIGSQRPPSYISEDGIEYAVQALPQSRTITSRTVLAEDSVHDGCQQRPIGDDMV